MSSMAQKLESWMHSEVARHVSGTRMLEIGSGTLNQLPYMVINDNTSYDIIEPMKFMYEKSPHCSKVRNFFEDISECYLEYDAIFSVAVLEHIVDLPRIVARSGVLLSSSGCFVNAIPCEGGMLWSLSWRCTTGVSYRLRTGQSYKKLIRHEHVNTYDEILALIGYFFGEATVSFFPLSGKHLSFYACVTARSPNLQRCRAHG